MNMAVNTVRYGEMSAGGPHPSTAMLTDGSVTSCGIAA